MNDPAEYGGVFIEIDVITGHALEMITQNN